MKSHRFNGRKYTICTEVLDGLCEIPKSKNLELHIFTSLKTKGGLVTAIHEALHAENGNWTEEYVDRMSREIGGFLWRLGFRMKAKGQ